MKSLVLLHGWGASRRLWHRQAGLEGDCRILAPAIPEWTSAWLADFLGALDLRRSVLAGWSLGGMLLLETLAEMKGAPPAGMVLVGTPAVFCQRPDHPWGQPMAALRAMRLGLRSDPVRVLKDFAASCLAPGEASFIKEAEEDFDFSAAPAYLAQGLDYLKEKDLRELLAAIPGPVTIIQGGQDRIVPPSQGQFLLEHLPGGRLHTLPDVGHLPFLTQAGTFNRILEELLLDL